ncbi:MAG: hypothetical protein ACUVTZ_04760 [Armatimonadota bacterium]
MRKLAFLTLTALLTVVSVECSAKSFLANGDFEDGAGAEIPGWSRGFYP